MGSPREAVYDVLAAKRQRAIDEKQIKTRDEWDRYEANNRAAEFDYRQNKAQR
jgi:hypothetical protein